MSLIKDLRNAEEQLKAAKAHLDALMSNPQLVKLKEFELELRQLMGKFGMSLKDVNHLLDPALADAPAAAPEGKKTKAKVGGRKGHVYPPRSLKRFTNPHTGESTESYGGINKVLGEWREKYGWDAVKTWFVIVDDK